MAIDNITGNLDIKKSGIINSGKLHWSYDEKSERLSWNGFVNINILFFKKRFDFDWCHKFNKSMMLSSNYNVGMILRIHESILIKCIGVHNRSTRVDNYANIRMIGDNESLVLIAKIGLDNQYIDILNIDANLNYHGIAMKLICVKEQ